MDNSYAILSDCFFFFLHFNVALDVTTNPKYNTHGCKFTGTPHAQCFFPCGTRKAQGAVEKGKGNPCVFRGAPKSNNPPDRKSNQEGSPSGKDIRQARNARTTSRLEANTLQTTNCEPTLGQQHSGNPFSHSRSIYLSKAHEDLQISAPSGDSSVTCSLAQTIRTRGGDCTHGPQLLATSRKLQHQSPHNHMGTARTRTNTIRT